MGQALEGTETFLNLFVIQDPQTVKTKGFYGKRGHDAPEHDRLLEGLHRPISRRSQMTQKASCKGIAGTGWITHVFQREGGSAKDLLLVEHQHPILSAFDDEMLGPPRQDFLRHLH